MTDYLIAKSQIRDEFLLSFTFLQSSAHEVAVEHGFWPAELVFEKNDYVYDLIVAQKMALIQAEVTEALEELRLDSPLAERKDKIKEELADVVIRTMDLAEALGLDLAEAIHDKIEKNKAREPKHGKRF